MSKVDLEKLEEFYNENKTTRDFGLEPVITVRTKKSKLTDKFLKDFERKLDEMLDKTEGSILALQYKERSHLHSNLKIEDYLKLLKLTRKVSNDHKIKITNGGLEDFALLTYIYVESGQDTKDLILEFVDANEKQYFTNKKYKSEVDRVHGQVKTLVSGYKEIGIDYLNIQWSEFSGKLFELVVNFYKEKFDFEIISTEIILPYNEQEAKDFMKEAKKLDLKCIIWYFPVEGNSAGHIVNTEGTLLKLARPLKRNFFARMYQHLKNLKYRTKDENINN